MGHDLVGLGEVMLRLAAPPPLRLDQALSLDVQIGGSEANVLAAVSRLGLRTGFITALPAEHAWGDRTVRELWGHGVDCAGVLRRPGSRMGLYFLEYGPPPRAVRVLYDRRESALSQLVPDEVDWGSCATRGWCTCRGSRRPWERICGPSSAGHAGRPRRPASPSPSTSTIDRACGQPKRRATSSRKSCPPSAISSSDPMMPRRSSSWR